MGETSIEWTDYTFNPWWGCARVSPGCENCYAETFSKRIGHGKRLPQIWGANAERKLFGEKHWAEPRRWNAKAAAEGRRARVFCASMADVFDNREDLVAPRLRLAELIDATTSLDWLLLTKRPENIVRLWPHARMATSILLGTTAENQDYYARRWLHLAHAARMLRARVTFISHEPAIGPLTLRCNGCGEDVYAHRAPDRGGCAGWFPSWVITGGESGGGARPFDLAWARSIRDQCKAANVACFVKQIGSAPVVGDTIRLHGQNDRKGGDWSTWPEDLRVRQWPEVAPC